MKKMHLLLLGCMSILVSGQSNPEYKPCSNSNSYGSCLTVCTNGLDQSVLFTCDSACAMCYGVGTSGSAPVDNSGLSSSSSPCSNSTCPDGSPACSGYTSTCYYPSGTPPCFCGPCPGVTTCGNDPPSFSTSQSVAIPSSAPVAAPTPAPAPALVQATMLPGSSPVPAPRATPVSATTSAPVMASVVPSPSPGTTLVSATTPAPVMASAAPSSSPGTQGAMTSYKATKTLAVFSACVAVWMNEIW